MNNFNIKQNKFYYSWRKNVFFDERILTYWSLNYIVKKGKKKYVKEGKICMSANTTNTRERERERAII